MIGSKTCRAEICGLHRGSRDTPQSPLVTIGNGLQRSNRGKGWLKDGEVGRAGPRQDSEDGAGTALRLAANAERTCLKKPVFCRNTNDCEWPCCRVRSVGARAIVQTERTASRQIFVKEHGGISGWTIVSVLISRCPPIDQPTTKVWSKL
ncbi:hypothetical protein LY76DRAFT_270220 [Colletotrichum caudatum]|nr:hypothetical protein LY76DRAFT_270220 [Colletotrichum caudatum]